MYDQTKVDPEGTWSNMEDRGQELYEKITDVFELLTNHRIKDDTDELTLKFIEEMNKIGDGTCSAKD